MRGPWRAGACALLLACADPALAQRVPPPNELVPPDLLAPPPVAQKPRLTLVQGPAEPPPSSSPAAPPPEAVPPPTVLLPPDPAPPEAAASDAAPVKPAAPPPRPRRTVAVIQALDKVTAESLRFAAPVNQPVRYKDLVFTVHACEDQGPAPAQRGAAAHLEIDSQPRPTPDHPNPPARQVFSGWMFAGAPGLHPLEHPVYDAWLIACRAESP